MIKLKPLSRVLHEPAGTFPKLPVSISSGHRDACVWNSPDIKRHIKFPGRRRCHIHENSSGWGSCRDTVSVRNGLGPKAFSWEGDPAEQITHQHNLKTHTHTHTINILCDCQDSTTSLPAVCLSDAFETLPCGEDSVWSNFITAVLKETLKCLDIGGKYRLTNIRRYIWGR